MRGRAYRHRPTKRRRRTVRAVAAGIVLILVLVLLDREVRPVILTMAGYQARVSSILAINQAVLEELEKDPPGQLVTVYQDTDGEVTAIETDTAGLNQLKARLTNAVGKKLEALPRSKISIPLGTLLGWQVLAGRGPDISFRVVPASFVESDLRTSLNSAGINQTHHQIYITFTVTMSAILPGYTADVTVSTEVCVVDTLIVGQVPQLYASG
ncbi:MAG: sporulation protein YunB [Pygmaiobacter massiliensis]|nr:sporulation protein YunB [Pygmaiobacter massiliensis]